MRWLPDQSPDWVVPALYKAFVIFGTAAIIGSIALLLARRRFLSTALRAPGRVMGYRTTQTFSMSQSARIITYHHATIEFTTAKGEMIRFESKLAMSRPEVPGPRPLMVLYDPAKPSHAEVESNLHLWFFEILMGVMGIVFVIVGVFVLSRLGPR